MQASKKSRKAIFFDRDGVLTVPDYNLKEKKDYAVRDASRLRLYRNCADVVNQVRKFGYLTFVFSNQPDIALGKIDEKTKTELESKFLTLIESKSILFEEIKYCHHHENSINKNYPKLCSCRKPKPGMLLKLSKKWNIDLKNSYAIGDTWKDILAGKKSGCKTILICKQWSHLEKCLPDYKVKNLREILDIIGV